MSAFGKRTRANDVNIYYQTWGEGPPLVLLHGALGTGAVWRDLVPYLADRYRVIAPDARGHGRSDNPGDVIRGAELAEDAAAFVRSLKLDKPILCGWSGGGDTALNVAIRYPELASAMIIGGVTYRMSERHRATLAAMGLEGPGKVNFDVTEAQVPEMVELWRASHAPLRDYWQTLLTQLSYEMAEPDLPSEEAVGGVETPTLVVLGDRDEFIDLEDTLALYRALPQGELAVIPGADHFVTRTRPESFAAVALEFLGRHLEGDGDLVGGASV